MVMFKAQLISWRCGRN